MPREKPNFRDMLQYLHEDKQCPLTMTQKEAAKVINVSVTHFKTIVAKGHIKVVDGKIPIGSVASYLCG